MPAEHCLGGRGSHVAPSRERTSFSCSAFACQSFQPRVTMVITSINHGSDRSLSKPALTCSHCRWCPGFLQHVGPQFVPLLPVPRGCKGWSAYQTQESTLERENSPKPPAPSAGPGSEEVEDVAQDLSGHDGGAQGPGLIPCTPRPVPALPSRMAAISCHHRRPA